MDLKIFGPEIEEDVISTSASVSLQQGATGFTVSVIPVENHGPMTVGHYGYFVLFVALAGDESEDLLVPGDEELWGAAVELARSGVSDSHAIERLSWLPGWTSDDIAVVWEMAKTWWASDLCK